MYYENQCDAFSFPAPVLAMDRREVFFRIKCILLYGHIGPAIGPKPLTINFTIMVDGFIETMHLRENRELQCKIICQ